MRSHPYGACLVVFALVALAYGTSTAQQCTDPCAADRCVARASCDMDYQTCLASAGGDPQLEALCAQQLAACYEAVDSTFISCVESCPTSEPCTATAWYQYGYELSSCNDLWLNCTMYNTPEYCDAQRLICQQQARERFVSRLLSRCATSCMVSVEHQTWSIVKSLYRD